MCTGKLGRGFLVAVPLFLVATGLVLLATKHQLFMAIFKSQLVLGPNSASFPMWQTLPEPMQASMYLFKVLNPDQVTKGHKPKLEQVGPYVFSEQHEKTRLVWNKNGTVTYRQIRTWHFLPHLSNGTLDDKVTILNSVAASLGPMIQLKVPKWLYPGLNMFLLSINESLFITKTVREIIFDGYHDPIFDDLEKLKEDLPFLAKFIPKDGITDKFAFFYNRNGTDYVDGVFNMFTGAGDVSQMGQVYSWNYSTQGDFPGSCGKVHGSAGEFWTPDLQKTHIDMFSNDLCRSVRLNFNQSVRISGIESYEYIADQSFFANGTLNPANSCFEPPGVSLPSGVYNTSLCRFGAPVFVSLPHFYNADPYYLSLVEGLQPTESEHATYFRIEPQSGIPTDVVARFQLNVRVAPIPGISVLSGVATTFFPVMWFENKAAIPKPLVSQMSLLANLQNICLGMGLAQIGLAISILIISALFYSSRKKALEEDTRPILGQTHLEEEAPESALVDKERDE